MLFSSGFAFSSYYFSKFDRGSLLQYNCQISAPNFLSATWSSLLNRTISETFKLRRNLCMNDLNIAESNLVVL